MMFLIRWIYNLAFPVVLLVLLPSFLIRMVRRGKYRHKFWQRFGVYSPRVLEKLGGRIWIHAVSVGEVMIAMKLIQAMRGGDPSAAFVLSTTTSTGFKLAARAKCPWLEPIYNPLDFFFTARRAVRAIRPEMLILVEAEVWPNIVCEARAAGARVVMVNARLSLRSERRFRAARWITAPIFNQLDVLCLQEPEDMDRWSALGVERKRLLVTGSIKFDESTTDRRAPRDFRPVIRALGVPDEAPVLLGGSTFEGEEVLLAGVFIELRECFPDLFLILVPRHFERAQGVVSQLEKSGLKVALRTQPPPSAPPDLLLVDTTGELRDWYACATVVFMGKSLCAKGGQNPAEPVAAGVPVVFGPHMQNFSTLCRQFLRHQGAVEVADAEGLRSTVARLLKDPELRTTMAANARRCLEVHQGATARTVSAIRG
jgi:3-deoxy-D-manno-octulosonic-acid transferase